MTRYGILMVVENSGSEIVKEKQDFEQVKMPPFTPLKVVKND
jgi:hypothetical protein